MRYNSTQKLDTAINKHIKHFMVFLNCQGRGSVSVVTTETTKYIYIIEIFTTFKYLSKIKNVCEFMEYLNI